MPRNISLYRDPVQAIRADFESDPRRQVIAALAAQGGNTAPAAGGWIEALARGLQGTTAGFIGGLEQDKLRKREELARETIARALMPEQVAPQGAEAPVGGGVTSQPISMAPTSRMDMARILAGNPDTAGMGFDLRLADMGREQEQATWQQRFAAEQAARQQAMQQQFEQQRTLRGIPQATAPVPGRDIPLPPEVVKQQTEMMMAEVQAKAAVKGVQLSEAQKELDKATAKELMPFVVGGGFADTQKGLEQLRLVEGELEKGGITGTTVGLTPDFALAPFNQRSVDAQNMVEEVVQRNLRTILGAQFTEKEGQRLIARAYNPHLTEKRNLRRVRALRQSIEQAAQAKQEAWEYLQQNGTLKGFEGKVWNIQDFNRAIDDTDGKTGKDDGNSPRETIPNKRGFRIERIE